MPEPPESAEIAADLRLVMTQFVRRYRAHRTMSGPQMQALIWLERQGPKTTSQLAALEQVRPQSMAQTVVQAEDGGLVLRRPDPSDGRQSLIELTEAGRWALDEYRRTGDAWVTEAMEARLRPEDRAEVARALGHLGRLLD